MQRVRVWGVPGKDDVALVAEGQLLNGEAEVAVWAQGAQVLALLHRVHVDRAVLQSNDRVFFYQGYPTISSQHSCDICSYVAANYKPTQIRLCSRVQF